jgi:hypothetical protein
MKPIFFGDEKKAIANATTLAHQAPHFYQASYF